MTSFFGELKRRNVVKVAVAYAIVGWVLIEVSTTVLPVFEAPDWIAQVFTFFIILGFPVALILSWAYEITPEGIKLERDIVAGESITRVTGRKLDFAIIGALVLALGFVVYNYVLQDGADESLEVAVVEPEQAILPNSVAVLPFENLTVDSEYSFFAPGIHDTILKELAKISDMNVIARTSVLQYADGQTSIEQIAEDLNVETVMEGSVQYAEGRVLVTAQLIDPNTSTHLWSESYDRELVGIFEIQADIATRIAMALEAELLPAERESIEQVPTTSPEAYALYLQAVANWNNFDFWKASLDQALVLDPDFALAYEEIAENYALAFRGTVEGWEQIVDQNAARALELDPTLTRARMAQAMALEARWRWTEAEAAFARALRANPNDPNILLFYGRFKRVTGDYDESIRMLLRAVELDPIGEGYVQLGISYKFSKMYNEAVAALSKAINLDPTARNLRIHVADAEIGRGNLNDALRHLQIGESLVADTPYRFGQTMNSYAQLDRPEEVARVFNELQQHSADSTVGNGTWAIAYLALGDQDAALRYLQTAVNNKEAIDSQALVALKANPWALPILEDPRFREPLDQVGGF